MRVGHSFLRSGLLMLAAGGIAFPGFAQAPVAPNRISQQIVVNGQPASGAYVISAAGGMQAFTCVSPQHYTTQDGSTQGWACYDQRTATYLLNALPPEQSQAQPRPAPVPQAPVPPAALPQTPLPPAPLPQPSGTVRGPAYPAGGYPAVGFPQPRPFGKVKIEEKRKDLMIYIDGGFAGRIKDLKSFSLPAGNHDIELREPNGQTLFKEQVQVIPQKTVEVKPVVN